MEEKFRKMLNDLLVSAKGDLEEKREALIAEFGDDRDLSESFEQGYLNAVDYIWKQFKKLSAPNKEFNDMTPKEATDTIVDFVVYINDNELIEVDERVSDAIKRVQQLVEEIE